MDISQSLEEKIIDIVGKDFVFIDKQDMVVYESDGTHDKGMPDFVVLPGTVDGKEPNDENLMNTINYLMTENAGTSSEVIFCPDESR